MCKKCCIVIYVTPTYIDHAWQNIRSCGASSPVKLCKLSAHLFCGVACSCEVCAGVQHCDEHAPWSGSLIPCWIPAVLDRCLGTCTSVRTLHRCRTRTPTEATHWPASSVNTCGCRTQTPTAAPLYHPYPQQILKSLLWHSTNIQHVTCPTHHLLFGNSETVWFRHIPLTWLCASLPSLFDLAALGLPISLLFGSFFPQRREKLGGNNDQKTSFRPHAERKVRGRGPRGTVLSNNICAIHSAWDKGGQKTRPRLGEEGGKRRLKIGGGITERPFFTKQDQFH